VIAAALKNAAETSVGKTTIAIHLAAYLQTLAPTLLVDGDVIRASTNWSKRGDGKGYGQNTRMRRGATVFYDGD
jgi:cellulose biosynthesis protein BcsQ